MLPNAIYMRIKTDLLIFYLLNVLYHEALCFIVFFYYHQRYLGFCQICRIKRCLCIEGEQYILSSGQDLAKNDEYADLVMAITSMRQMEFG